MKLTVSEMAKLAGVSVRTLHYYDDIGLLSPDYVDEHNGYRYYCDMAVSRLQEILFYRELDFSLKEIRAILSNPQYDKMQSLQKHKTLLLMKKERLERIISLVDDALKGENNMSIKEFDNSEYNTIKNEYAKEAEERWGNTDAYAQSVKKTSSYSKEKWDEVNDESNSIFADFAKCRDLAPSDERVQALVQKWKDFISKSYYQCSNEILAGLGLMYVNDERFTANLDKFGVGTAKLMSDAIAIYCGSFEN